MIGLLIEFAGLLAIVKSGGRVSIVALNVDAEPNVDPGDRHPWHQPTLVLDRQHIVPGSARPNAVFAPRRAAYDLSDTFVTIKPKGEVGMQVPEMLLTQLGLPKPQEDEQWFDLWWSLDIRDEHANARLRSDWATSPAVAARLDASGGYLFAFKPKFADQETAPWTFHAQPPPDPRVLTDHAYYLGVAGDEGFTVEMRSRAGVLRTVGVRLTERDSEPLSFGELNAYPVSEAAGEFGIGPGGEFSHRHFTAIYDLLENPPVERTVPVTHGLVQQATDACLIARIVQETGGTFSSIHAVLKGDIGAAVRKKLGLGVT